MEVGVVVHRVFQEFKVLFHVIIASEGASREFGCEKQNHNSDERRKTGNAETNFESVIGNNLASQSWSEALASI